MSIEAALFTIVTGDVAIAALIGDRMVPVIKSGDTYPLVRFQKIDGRRDRTLSGPNGLALPRFQLDSWATTYDAARDLADKLRLVLDGYDGTVGGVRLLSVVIEDERDLHEAVQPVGEGVPRLFGRSQDYTVWHDEAYLGEP